MKLAKKMLACAVALAMVAALALTAFAAPTTLAVKAEKSTDGKQVVVTVSATDYANFKSGALTVEYDPAALQFVKGSGTPTSAMDGITVVAGIPADMTAEDGVISVGLMYAEVATNATEDVFMLTFNVLKNENSTIAVKVGEWDGTDKPADASGKVVLVEETTAAPTTAAPTTAAPTTAAPTTEEVSVAPSTDAPTTTPPMGDVGVAAVAGVMALAAVAFVVTRKKDAE